MSGKPSGEIQLRITVSGRGVDVIDALSFDERQGLLDSRRLHRRQGSGPEKHT
jgi:hypothetical protein